MCLLLFSIYLYSCSSSTLVWPRNTETTGHDSTYRTEKTKISQAQLAMPVSTHTWASSRGEHSGTNYLFSFCSLCSNQLSLQSLCSNQAISSLKSFTITSSITNSWSWHFVVLSDWWTVFACPLPNEWHVSGQRVNLGMVYTIPPAHVLYTTFAF